LPLFHPAVPRWSARWCPPLPRKIKQASPTLFGCSFYISSIPRRRPTPCPSSFPRC
jgi:hypothetical protein